MTERKPFQYTWILYNLPCKKYETFPPMTFLGIHPYFYSARNSSELGKDEKAVKLHKA